MASTPMRSAPTMTPRKVSEFPSAMELLPQLLQWRTRHHEIRCKRPPAFAARSDSSVACGVKGSGDRKIVGVLRNYFADSSFQESQRVLRWSGHPHSPPGCSARWHQADVSATARRGEIRRGVAPSMFEIDEPSPAHYEMIEPITCRD